MKISINSPWGDSTDTLIHNKPLDSWYKEYPILPYNVFKLPEQYSFNLDEMRNEIATIFESTQTESIQRNREGKKYNRYKGLGFFARDNAENPLSDHFTRRDTSLGEVFPDDLHLNDSLPDLYENDFVNPTQIYNDYFKQIFSVFKHSISKASLLELRSKGYLGSHVDFPYYKGIRLHATISGGENAWYEINGEKFQIPADGNWYFIDTGKYHSVWNEGPDDRLTINVNLSDVLSDPQELANSFKL
jgi:hypothetical protein